MRVFALAMVGLAGCIGGGECVGADCAIAACTATEERPVQLRQEQVFAVLADADDSEPDYICRAVCSSSDAVGSDVLELESCSLDSQLTAPVVDFTCVVTVAGADC